MKKKFEQFNQTWQDFLKVKKFLMKFELHI